MNNLLKLLFPSKCVICVQSGDLFCDQCLNSFRVLNQSKYFSSYAYSGVLRALLRKAKYGSKTFAIYDCLVKKSGFSLDAVPDLILPIPISKSRMSERGFNQATIIAKSLKSHFFRTSRVSEILVRSKQTIPQFGLSIKARKENLSDAFTLTHSVKGKSVLLVDDIVTTGSTFDEALKILKSGGCSDVYTFALCGVKKRSREGK